MRTRPAVHSGSRVLLVAAVLLGGLGALAGGVPARADSGAAGDDNVAVLRSQADALEWLDKLAPPSWREQDGEVARELLPNPGDYRHHRGGEDNGDAHLKNLLVHHQVIVPVTDGRLDLGPWQQVFYCEFDGGRPKRLIIKVMGE